METNTKFDKTTIQKNDKEHDTESFFMSEASSSSFDLASWIFKLLKYWYLFVIGLFFAVGFAYLSNKTWTPTYRSSTTILIEDNKSNFKNDFTSGYNFMGSNKNFINQMIMYNSHDLITKAVESLNITNEIYIKQRFKNIILYGKIPFEIETNFIADNAYGMEFRINGIDSETYSISYEGDDKVPAFTIEGVYGEFVQHNLFFVNVKKTDYFVRPVFELHFKFISKAQLVGNYSSRLSTRMLAENSSVIEVSLTGKVAQRDIDFLNVLNEQFFKDNLDRKNEIAEKSIHFLDRHIAIIKDSIDVSEEKLNTYQMSSGLYNSDISSSRVKELDELNARRENQRLRSNYINLLSTSILNSDKEFLPDPASFGVTSSSLAALIDQYNGLIVNMKSLGESNPVYKSNQITLENVKSMIQESIVNLNSTLRMEEVQINQRYNQVRAEIANLPKQERRLLTYERDFKINDTYYTYLIQRRTESQIQKASNTHDNLIIDNPRVVGIVNAAEKRDKYFIYVLIGIIVPFAFVACKEFLFKFSVQTRDEVEKITRVPLLGTIETSKQKGDLVVKSHPRSSFAEGFRSLRSRMEYVVKKDNNISMLITSTEPRDGKTFIVLNFASIYKIAGKKVLVVDLDLRRPAMSKSVGLDKEEGLTSYLIGQSSIDDIIYHHKESGLDIIPAGAIPPNPSELIRSEKTDSLIQELKERYDIILLDCSPVGLVSDAYYLSHLVDVLLYVVRNEKTNKKFLKYTIRELREDGINNMAVIYNDVDIKHGYYGNRRYYGKSSYYLRHGNYYHEE